VRNGITARLALVAALVLLAGPVAAQEQPAAFWQQLGDTTLTRLTAEALQANQDVRVAMSRVRQARAARLNAQLDLAPTITVAGGYTWLRTSTASFGIEVPDRELWDAEVRAAWELDVFGRLRKNLRGQSALGQSAEQDVRDVGRVIAAELATAYYELRGAQAQLEVARRNAENQRGTLHITQERLEAGRGTALDTERAQAQLSSTLGFIPVFESRVTAAQYRIGVLVGRDPRTVVPELTGAAPLPNLPDQAVPGESDSLLRARPDVQAAERRLAAETAFVGAAKAEYWPRLTVGGTAGYTATSVDSLGDPGSGRYAVGPVLSWPALNLGRVKAGVDQARALESEARARYEQTVLLAREEMETSLVTYARARERLTQLEEAAGASERAADLARLRYEGGVADFLQVLDAQRTVLVAQDQLAQGRTDAITALVSVYRAHGEGEVITQ
jgi:outer membrane protein, multidrug efflux system